VRVLSRECPKDPPETVITGPSGTQRTAAVSFGFSADEAGSTFECRTSAAAAFAACTAPLQRSGLPDGAFTLEVRAIDPAGITDPTPAASTVTIAVPPVIKSFTVTRTRFRVGPGATAISAAKPKKQKLASGTTFGLIVSEPGRLRITLDQRVKGRRVGRSCRKATAKLRRRKSCTRIVRVGTLTRKLTTTSAKVKFSGRLGRRRLAAGTYTATATVTDAAGNVSAPKSRTLGVRR
jgi:hypothetical protein